MPRKEIFETGKFKYSYKHYNVLKDLADSSMEGRVFEKEFAQQLLAAGGVLQPIITTSFEGREIIIDGRRRLLHSRRIAEMSKAEITELVGPDSGVKPSDFQFITAKMFYDISPQDQSVWSIILNEERKDNLIHAYLQMKQLEKDGKWDEIQKMYKINKSRFARFAQLEKLKEQDFWLEAYAKGKVTEVNLMSVAKLGGRQGFVKEILETKGKLTGRDIIEAKTVSVAAAINNAPTMNMPTQFVQRVTPNLFAMLKAGDVTAEVGEFGALIAKKRELGLNEYHIFRLVEVG